MTIPYESGWGLFAGAQRPSAVAGHFVNVTPPPFARGRCTVRWRGRKFTLRTLRATSHQH